MRKYVYQTLSAAKLKDPTSLLLILEKSIAALQADRADKKHIYRMLASLGKRYYLNIGTFIQSFGVIDQHEPNCRSVIYKAKMVFCFAWWQQLKDKTGLPLYFGRHMLYIRDIQSYLFEENYSMIDETATFDVSKIPKEQLTSFIEC